MDITSAILIILGLALFESITSIDNAIINAEVLQGMLYGRLCPRMTTTFLQGLSNFYIGNRVRLSSGEVGEVVWIDRFIPTRPTVRVGDKYYDLMRQREIHIVEEILEPESEF
ncbi:MAG: hypothetical protein QHH02_07155 [Syntrophomonadaceae bacterium]|nr:hypothetical protein [Syntrophomonadaceae bacterium]